jgi:glutamate synthase domain-containing protein 1
MKCMTEEMKKIEWFYNYCLDFYGVGGIYDMGATKDEIVNATTLRLLSLTERTKVPFDGDTVDRELVRDIMLELRDGAIDVEWITETLGEENLLKVSEIFIEDDTIILELVGGYEIEDCVNVYVEMGNWKKEIADEMLSEMAKVTLKTWDGEEVK